MHSAFSTFLYVFSARDLGVVIDSGLTITELPIICMLNFDSETLCLTLTELYKNYNITSLLLTLKGPKGPTLGHFPSQGAAAPLAPPLNPPLSIAYNSQILVPKGLAI